MQTIGSVCVTELGNILKLADGGGYCEYKIFDTNIKIKMQMLKYFLNIFFKMLNFKFKMLNEFAFKFDYDKYKFLIKIYNSH